MSSSKINLGKVALTPKGEWSATTTYERLDVVSYQGSSYTVLKTCVGQVPVEGEYYSLLAEKGDSGEQGTELGWLDASKLIVSSFNSRSGHVVPMAGDYTPEMVGAAPVDHTHNSDYYQKPEVNNLIQKKSGENLADNWYLCNPVNQLGKDVYEASSLWTYSIDMFKSSGMKVSIKDDFVNITSIPNLCKWSRFTQMLDMPLKANTYYTLSIYARLNTADNIRLRFVDDLYGTIFNMTGISTGARTLVKTEPYGFSIYSVTMKTDKDFERFGFEILVSGDQEVGSEGSCDIDIKAFKVEIGNQQTLGYQDGDAWVLNDPPPNKAKEILKCKRYATQLVSPVNPSFGSIGLGIASAPTIIRVDVPLFTPLRVTPSVKFSGRFVAVAEKLWNSDDHPEITKMEVMQMSENIVTLEMSVNGTLDVGKVYRLIYNTSESSLMLDANMY